MTFVPYEWTKKGVGKFKWWLLESVTGTIGQVGIGVGEVCEDSDDEHWPHMHILENIVWYTRKDHIISKVSQAVSLREKVLRPTNEFSASLVSTMNNCFGVVVWLTTTFLQSSFINILRQAHPTLPPSVVMSAWWPEMDAEIERKSVTCKSFQIFFLNVFKRFI